ncbi:MAG: hypothetical protein HYX26_03575 [Acidobacteriales bacterium]|nr:hypothetical protein [Terriglobales bacterium]
MAVTHEHHAPALPRPEELVAPASVTQWRKYLTFPALILTLWALIGLGLNFGDPVGMNHFLRAYLVGFMFCCGLTLGCLVLLMVQHVTGGKWGLVMRRIFEAGSRNWWLMALMFVPIAAGLKYLYPWANHTGLTAHGEHALHVREAYLNPKMFIIRAIAYFAAWGLLAVILNRWSLRQDHPPASPEEGNALRLRFMRLSGFGILFYAVSLSLAVVDWVMSLDAVWYSTIYGMLYMAGQALLAMSFAIIVLVMLAKTEPMKHLLRKNELHDNGKFLLAFVMLYTYLSFSQFIIIWSGNLKEEIPWYLARSRNGWLPVFLVLAIFHFVVPFLLLLNRNLKKQGERLAMVAAMLVLMRYLDLYWHILPNFADVSWPTGNFDPTLWDLVVPAAMACVWFTLFFRELGTRPILPLYHPLFPQIMEKSHGAH